MDFADLDEWMTAEAMSDHELAQLVGCARQTINRLRHKRIKPSVSMIIKIIRASKGALTANALVASESVDAQKPAPMSSAEVSQHIGNKR